MSPFVARRAIIAVAALDLVLTACTGDGPIESESTISITLSEAALTLEQGQSGTATATITRGGGFTGAVDLTAAGVPAGTTVSFDPATIPAGAATSTMTMTVGTTAPTGSSTITVRARGVGVTDQTKELALTVATPELTNVSFRFCETPPGTPGSPLPLPIWVAYQDRLGPWTRVTAGANNTYSFTISSRGGVAIVTPRPNNGASVEVIYAAASELAEFGPIWDNECSLAPGTKQLTGTVASVGTSQYGVVDLGPAYATVPAGGTSYTLRQVPEGALDLVAVRFTSGAGFNDDANKLIIRRGLDLPNGSSIPLLDFNAAEAVRPDTATLTIGGLDGDEYVLSLVDYLTPAGTYASLTSRELGPGARQHAYQAVPGSLQAPGDVFQFDLWAVTETGDDDRTLLAAFRTAGHRTLTLGPKLATPTVSVLASSPYCGTACAYRSRASTARWPLPNSHSRSPTASRPSPSRPVTWAGPHPRGS